MVHSHNNFNMKVLRFNRAKVIAQSGEIFVILISLFSNFGKIFNFLRQKCDFFPKTFPKSTKNSKLFRNHNSGITAKYSALVF